MPVPLLDLTRQYEPLREEIRKAIDRVCDSQRFILGAEVEDEGGEKRQVIMLPQEDRFIGSVVGVQGKRPVRIVLNTVGGALAQAAEEATEAATMPSSGESLTWFSSLRFSASSS